MKITYDAEVDALYIQFLETTVTGVFHRTLLEYPEEAVLEAIVDATAHCNYGARQILPLEVLCPNFRHQL